MKLKIPSWKTLKDKLRKPYKNTRLVDHAGFLKSLDNIARVQELKIKNGDISSSIANLEWLQGLFSQMMVKSISDPQKFSEYFKPKVDEDATKENAFPYYVDIGYRHKAAQNSNYLLTNKFLELIDDGFQESIEVRDYGLANSHLQVLLNWNCHLNKLMVSVPAYRYIFKTLFNINTDQYYYFLAEAYKTKNKTPDSIRYVLLYEALLVMIFNEKYAINDNEILNDLYGRLFDHLKLALQNGAEKDYESFIHDIISGSYFPYGNTRFIENLYRLASAKGLDLKEEIRQLNLLMINILFLSDYEKLQNIVTSTLPKLQSVLNEEEYSAIAADAADFLVKSFNVYKANRLKITVFQTLAYALFRRQYQLVENAFKKHTPDDANAHFGNHDMVNFYLGNCLQLIRKQDTIEHEVTFKWDDHHGADIYLSVINVYYLAKAIRLSRNYEMNGVYNHIQQLDSGELEWLKSRLGYLKNTTLHFMHAKN